MKHSIDLRWIGDTVSKGRPRFSRVGGRVITFTDAKTRSYEKNLGQWFAFHTAVKKFPVLDVPCGIDIVFVQPRPKKPKFEFPAVKFDLDNRIKAVMDAGNGVLWDDDSLVCKINAEKIYPGPLSLAPGFILKVYEL